MQNSQRAKWHAIPAGEVFERLGSSHEGLPTEEARIRLGRFGPNEIRQVERRSPILTFLDQFRSPLIYILLIAAVLSFVSAHPVDAAVIVAIVVLNSVIGFLQEHRAERALESLRRLAALRAAVIRGGDEEDINAAEIVPGDVVMLEAGDKVPADGRLFLSVNLKVDQSALTGESVPAQKRTDPVPADAPLAELENMVYSGSTVTYGRGMAVVTETGMSTEIGRIAEAVAAEPRQSTPVQKKLARLGGYLGIAGLVIAVAVILAGLARRLDLYELFFLAVAASVSFIPEGLPAVVTVVLAVGVQRMARKRAVVRNLPAVETLGSATVICTDKTGTLTKNELTVTAGYTARTRFTVTGDGYAPEGGVLVEDRVVSPDEHPDIRLLLTAMVLCNDARLHYEAEEGAWRMVGDPTEGALVVAGAKAGLKKHDLEGERPRIGEIPFDSEKRYMATLHETSDGRMVAYVKGAPERIIGMSDRYHTRQGPAELTSDIRADFAARDGKMAADAMRVLASAYKEMPSDVRHISESDVESGLIYIGALGMIDPPREEARSAIAATREAGIRVIVVTGDHADTARRVAELLGLMEPGMSVVPGATVDSMSDEQLVQAIDHIAVFARAEPEHKIRIVRALKSRGQIVAMTGDGVNDAPALKLADIGIAMGITGTDVAKEAADMVLLDDNFATIVSAIEEGRGIFANIRRVVLYLLATNSGEILIYLATILGGLPIPLIPVQILWINLVTDGFATVPLALEPREVGVLKEPPRKPDEPILSRPLVNRIVYFALLMFVGTFVFYYREVQNLALDRARTYAFVVMGIYQVFNALNVRSDKYSLFRIGFFSNPYIIAGTLAALAAQIVAVHTPFFRTVLHTVPLSLWEWLGLIALSSTILWAEEIRKAVVGLMHRSRRQRR